MTEKERLKRKLKDTEEQIKECRQKIEEDETNFSAVLALESFLSFKEDLEEELENLDSD